MNLRRSASGVAGPTRETRARETNPRHATAILCLALQFAHDRLRLEHVLVTCDDDNVGSIKTIEKNGCVLEDVVSGPDLDKPKRRYWIDAGRGAA